MKKEIKALGCKFVSQKKCTEHTVYQIKMPDGSLRGFRRRHVWSDERAAQELSKDLGIRYPDEEKKKGLFGW